MQSRVTNDLSLETEARDVEAIERKVWREVDVSLYPSQEEVDEVKELDPSVDARSFVPFCFDEFRSLRKPRGSHSIIFVAGFAHPPNVDAAIWLVREIMPLVRREVPDANLRLVGSNPTAAVRELATDFVQVTGYVTSEQLQAFYSDARVSVVPLRFGAGVKLKVVEAVHEGIPLVTTAVGAQGLEGLSEVVPMPDNAEAIAAAIVELLCDDAKWCDQAQRQLDYAEARFSRRASIAAISEAVEAAIEHAERRRKAV
jgi:glycosyltransferase involved in cell wall biosynthesis